MRYRQLGIAGAWEFTPTLHSDARGTFLEAFTADSFTEATGRNLIPAQVNTSVSSRGVIRGIHAARRPPSQAKYVMCAAGAILDVIVDLRLESLTFGQWDCVTLDEDSRRSVFLDDGLGHAFCVLSPSATVVYITSTPYNPAREFNIHPLDPTLALPWPDGLKPSLSARDAEAPAFEELLQEPRTPFAIEP